MELLWVSLSCILLLFVTHQTQAYNDDKECGPAPTPFELMRNPFYAPDLEEIVQKEFGLTITVSAMQREELQKMYADMVKRALHNRDIVNILDDIKETWKKQIFDWQMRGCLEKLRSEREELLSDEHNEL